MGNKKETLWYIVLVLLNVISGCVSKPSSAIKSWQPAPKQLSRTEEIARQYARHELNVSGDQLSRMKVKSSGWQDGERKILYLQFYDPEHFPNWENIGGVLGGFPFYFTIKVDASTWTIVDHYASVE